MGRLPVRGLGPMLPVLFEINNGSINRTLAGICQHCNFTLRFASLEKTKNKFSNRIRSMRRHENLLETE